MHSQALPFPTLARKGRLERLGLFLRRRRPWILGLQWAVVLCYAFLVVVPVFLPLPESSAHIWNNLRLFAQFVFWGLWWPGVMIATVLLGRVWCGVLCPEGALSEFASRFGRGKPVPTWLKWSGWPFVAFICTTLYGQLVSVYEYPQAALLVLGGSTLAAIALGLIYGRGKRIWCRYLCPASAVFALLARLAPIHYKVDRERWDHPENPVAAFNCPPLVDVRRMTSAAECHACGGCAGQRDAVTLATRLPGTEILDPAVAAKTAEAITLLFGLLGVATTAFQWTVSPWLLKAKLGLAEWLVEHEYFALLDTDIPWWLLTHYPEAGDLFTWLDGLLIIAYVLGGGFLLGAVLWVAPALVARLNQQHGLSWQRLSLTLIPLGAASLILGLSMLTVTHLKAEHLWLGWLPSFRIALLLAGCLASQYLSYRMIFSTNAGQIRKNISAALMLHPTLLIAGVWSMVFFVW